MAHDPKLHPREQDQAKSYDSIRLGRPASSTRSKSRGGLTKLDEVYFSDSAFLAERGIFAQAEPVRLAGQAKSGPHRRRGEASN